MLKQTRENFDETRMKAEELKAKYMDSKMVCISRKKKKDDKKICELLRKFCLIAETRN